MQEFTAHKRCRIYFDDARGISASTFLRRIAAFDLKYMSLHTQHSPHGHGGSPLPEHLTHPRNFLEGLSASEPRDYVFALKPILQNILQSVKVDYSASVGQVFREATQGYVSYTQRLDIMGYATIKSDIPDLPSWAADWRSQKTPLGFPLYNPQSTD